MIVNLNMELFWGSLLWLCLKTRRLDASCLLAADAFPNLIDLRGEEKRLLIMNPLRCQTWTGFVSWTAADESDVRPYKKTLYLFIYLSVLVTEHDFYLFIEYLPFRSCSSCTSWSKESGSSASSSRGWGQEVVRLWQVLVGDKFKRRKKIRSSYANPCWISIVIWMGA